MPTYKLTQVGDVVMVTSSDVQWGHSEQRTITAIARRGSGTVELSLDSPLQWEHEGGSRFSAEVALLTRRIVVQVGGSGHYMTGLASYSFFC